MAGASGRGTDSPTTPRVRGSSSVNSGRPPQAVGGGAQVAGEILLVRRQQPPVAHHDPALHDHGLRAGGRRQCQRLQGVGDGGVSEVVNPENRQVGAAAGLERSDLRPAQALGAAAGGERPRSMRVERPRPTS